jgi:3-oxoacyl-[acyl-carrier-protein] synthase II
MFAGFHALGVLSADKCGPFGQRYGTTLGEGAGFFVLETRAGARARAVRVRASLLGYGLSGDAFHETGPDPTGSGVARAIRAALGHAGVRPEEIGYVNAHGTGTAANDPAEWRALQSVFGARARELPTSSTKSVIGHAQAAAGVLETLATLLGMERQLLPQTLNVGIPRANCPPDPVAQSTPRPGAFRHALCCNSAFGGANASVVVAAPDADEHARVPMPTRRVFVAGIGAALPHAVDAGALLAAFLSGKLDSGKVDLDAHHASKGRGPSTDLASLDPSSRHLTAAAALALEDAGVGRVRGDLRNSAGLVCGINLVSPASVRDLRRSIDERGLPLLSATAFSRMVLNAPAGTCSKALSLRGPLSTVSIGRGSGLLAILYAGHLLSEREDVALMLAGGVDELDAQASKEQAHPSEGAACVMLSPAPPRPSPERSVHLAGWGIAGPGDIERAITRALQSASLPRAAVERVFGAKHPPGCGEDAVSSALDFVSATLCLRSGRARTVMVVASGGRSASCAAILDTEGA